MQAPEVTTVLKYDHLVVSSRGLAEAHGRKVVLFVPAAEIKRITLKFGRSDHRPAVSITIGVIFSLVGVLGLVAMFRSLRGMRYELAMITLGVIGGSMIFDTLKQRYFFEVEDKSGVSRLVFSKRAQLKDVQDFCRQIRAVYKYDLAEDL